MIVNPDATLTLGLADMLSQSSPADYPVTMDALEGARILTVADESGVRAVLAYRIQAMEGRSEIEIVGLNARGAPFLLRTAWAGLEAVARERGGRIIAMIETDGMASFVEKLGMELRALMYVKDVS